MQEAVQFVLHHGYLVLVVWVFAEQVGLPLPSMPILLAAGALAGVGRMNFELVLALPIAAALVTDLAWYEIGRRRGSQVLQFLCRISLEPDSCVRRTEEGFARQGAHSLLLAKFLPGIGAAAPPLAGIIRMRLSRFLLFDAAGASLWIGTYVALGFLFSSQLERVAKYAARLGAGLVVIVLGSFAAHIGWKYYQRWRFIRDLRIARITPEELKRRLDAGEDIVIVDLRHSLDFESEPDVIPGAVHLEPEELEESPAENLRDREVVLYCT